MALSFEKEMEAFLRHRFEQLPAVHAATTQGQRSSTLQESMDYIGASMRIYQDAIFSITREIDKLRATIEGGKD